MSDNYISNQFGSSDRVLPLDATLKTQFERVFGVDLSNVKIHIGLDADRMTRENGAFAITMGTDIYFSNGLYSPETVSGLKLLAHELQHVVQYINNRDTTYDENIADLESEAHGIEFLFETLSLYDVDAPLFGSSTLSEVQVASEGYNLDKGLKKETKWDEAEGVDLFKQKKSSPTIRVILDSAKETSLSSEEYIAFLESVKEGLINLFYSKKLELTSEKWDEFVMKFFHFIKQ